MSETKLTDFTAEQLQKLLTAVVTEELIRAQVYPNTQDEDLQLWRVQILNAISTVQRREQIANS